MLTEPGVPKVQANTTPSTDLVTPDAARSTDDDGRTLLHWAVAYRSDTNHRRAKEQLDILRALLQAGADVAAQDSE